MAFTVEFCKHIKLIKIYCCSWCWCVLLYTGCMFWHTVNRSSNPNIYIIIDLYQHIMYITMCITISTTTTINKINLAQRVSTCLSNNSITYTNTYNTLVHYCTHPTKDYLKLNLTCKVSYKLTITESLLDLPCDLSRKTHTSIKKSDSHVNTTGDKLMGKKGGLFMPWKAFCWCGLNECKWMQSYSNWPPLSYDEVFLSWYVRFLPALLVSICRNWWVWK